MPSIASLREPKLAAHLLDDLRARVLVAAHEPLSAAQIAEKVGLTRQRINYHVRILAKAGLLREAGRRDRRNLTEVLYVVSSPHYLIDPQALGPLVPAPEAISDATSPDRLLALAARTQTETGRLAQTPDARVSTMDLEVRLAPGELDAFHTALAAAIQTAVDQFNDPRGQTHRLVTACYQKP